MISIFTYIWKIQRVVCLIICGHIQMKVKTKTNWPPVFDQFLTETMLVQKKYIPTSYESPDTQLVWARGTRAWHTHGGSAFTSLQIFYIFSLWGRGGHVRLMKWKNNVLYQISLSQDPKNHVLLNKVSQNHEKNGHLKCINMSWRTLYKRITKRQILYIFLIFLKVSTHK